MKEILIRPANADDIPFICDSFWRSSKRNPDGLNMATIKGIVNHPDTRIDVACLPDDESVIVGYKVNGAGLDEYFLYVKVAFRNLGIERMLA